MGSSKSIFMYQHSVVTSCRCSNIIVQSPIQYNLGKFRMRNGIVEIRVYKKIKRGLSVYNFETIQHCKKCPIPVVRQIIL